MAVKSVKIELLNKNKNIQVISEHCSLEYFYGINA